MMSKTTTTTTKKFISTNDTLLFAIYPVCRITSIVTWVLNLAAINMVILRWDWLQLHAMLVCSTKVFEIFLSEFEILLLTNSDVFWRKLTNEAPCYLRLECVPAASPMPSGGFFSWQVCSSLFAETPPLYQQQSHTLFSMSSAAVWAAEMSSQKAESIQREKTVFNSEELTNHKLT